jgi:hypothetical protein
MVGSSTNRVLGIAAYGGNPGILLRRANGTVGSPTALLSGETAAVIRAGGYGATGFDGGNGASLQFPTTENWTDSAQGQNVIITATANGSAVSSTVGTFTSTGLAVTGTLSATGAITNTSGDFIRSGAAGGVRGYWIKTSGTNRWFIYANGTAESGSSAGSNFAIAAYNDAGSGLGDYFSINRATGAAAFAAGLAVTGKLSSTAASNIFTFVNSTAGSATNKISFGVTTNEYSFINYDDTTGYLSIGQPSGRSYGVNIQTNGANVGVFTATGLAVTGALSCTGALSKGSGSFRIEHPLPSKSATHQLVHSFIEGPKCDLIYRGKINLVDGKATVNIDTDSTMTEGTFEALCANVQCFTSNESGWGAIRGKVVGNILTIEAQDAASTDNVSWMVIGERKDKHIMDTDWTDDNGRPIVEPLKPAEPSLESK